MFEGLLTEEAYGLVWDSEKVGGTSTPPASSGRLSPCTRLLIRNSAVLLLSSLVIPTTLSEE